jgi:hypothetical protein
MPSLLEDIARRRQAAGVSVYSPARPLFRPQGGMASSRTAGQILNRQGGNQQPQNQQLTVPRMGGPGAGALPGYQPPQDYAAAPGAPLPVPGAGRTDYIGRLLAQRGAQPQQQEPGGWRGVLGSVVNSVPGKAVMGALNVLDVPRRLVVSTVQEGVDAINGGDASFSDWRSQIADPNFGFGNVIGDTGNIWANRIIGFVGDVVLDPMTYVAGAGAISGTGRRMRVSAAAAAIGEGLSDDTTRRLGRYGISALTNAERAELRKIGIQALDRGYYFRRPFSRGANGLHRIPGTGYLDEAVGKFTSGIRAGINSTGPVGSFRRLRLEEGLEDAAEKLITGKGVMSYSEAAATIRYTQAASIARGGAEGNLAALSNHMVQKYGNRKMSDLIDEAERTGDNFVTDYFNRAADLFEGAGGAFPRGRRSRYVPHILTDPALDWLKSDAPLASAFRAEFFKGINLDEISPHMFQRKLVARAEPYKLANGQEIQILDGTIKGINEAFRKLMPDAQFKLLDDNFSTIASRYSSSIAEDIGRLGGLKSLANSKSRLVRRLLDTSSEVVDDQMTELANHLAGRQLKQEVRAAQKLVSGLKSDVDKGITDIRNKLTPHMRQAVEELATVRQERKDLLDDMLARHEAAVEAYSTAKNDTDAVVQARAAREDLRDVFNDEIGQLDTRYERLERRRAELVRDAAAEAKLWKGAMLNVEQLKQLGRTPQRLARLAEWNKIAAEAMEVAMDRQVLTTLRDAAEQAAERAQLVRQRMHDESFQQLVLGAERGPAREWVDPLDGEVRQWIPPFTDTNGERVPGRWRRVTPGTERPVYADPNRMTREQARIAGQQSRRDLFNSYGVGDDSVIRELQVRISAKLKNVEDAERRIDLAASVHSENIQRAQSELTEVRQLESNLKQAIDTFKGYPELADMRQNLRDELAAMRAAGGEIQTKIGAYQQMQRPIQEAKALRDFELEQLQTLQKHQENRALSLIDEGRRPRRITEREHLEAAADYTRNSLRQEINYLRGQQEVQRQDRRRVEELLDRRNQLETRRTQLQSGQRTTTMSPRATALHEQIDSANARLNDLVGKKSQAVKDERAGLVAQIRAARDELNTMEGLEPGTTRVGSEELRYSTKELTSEIGQIDASIKRLEADIDPTDYDAEIAKVQGRLDKVGVDSEFERNRVRSLRQELRTLQDEERNFLNTGQGRIHARQTEDVRRLDGQIDAADRVIARHAGPDRPFMLDDEGNILPRSLVEKEIWDTVSKRDEIVQGSLKIARTKLETARADLAAAVERNADRAPAEKAIADARKEVNRLQSQVRRHNAKLVEAGLTPGMATSRATAMKELKAALEAKASLITRRDELNDALVAVSTQRSTRLKRIDAMQRELANREQFRRIAQGQMDLGITAQQRKDRLALALEELHDNEATNLSRAGRPINYKYDWEDVPEQPPAFDPMGANQLVFLDDEALDVIRQHADLMGLETPAELDTAIDKLAAARSPLNLSRRRKKDRKILDAMEMPIRDPKGGDNRVITRAKDTDQVAGMALEPGGVVDQLIDRRATPTRMKHKMEEWRAELGILLDRYEKTPSPMISNQIEQVMGDLNRMTNVSLVYHNVITHGGAKPDDKLATFILVQEIAREDKILLKDIADTRVDIKRGGVSADIRNWQLEIEDLRLQLHELKDDVAEQQNFFEINGHYEHGYGHFRRTRDRMYARQRRIEELRRERPEHGALRDAIDSTVAEVRAMILRVDAVQKDAKIAEDIATNLRGTIRERQRLEAIIPYNESHLLEDEAAQRRLTAAITKARAEGRDTVRYTPTERTRVSRDYLIAKAMLEAGEIPEAYRQFVINQIEKTEQAITRRNRGLNRTGRTFSIRDRVIDKETGRVISSSRPKREMVEWSAANKAKKVKEIPLAQAEAEAMINQQSINNMKAQAAKDEARLAIYDGSAQTEAARLKLMLEDVENPPSIQALRGRNKQIRDIDARRKPPGLTAEEQKEIFNNNARIERLEQFQRAMEAGDQEGLEEIASTVEQERIRLAELLSGIREEQEKVQTAEGWMVSSIDGANQFLREFIDGTRPPTPETMRILRDIFSSGEVAEFMRTHVEVINDFLQNRRTIGEDEMREMVEAFRQVVGDNNLSDVLMRRSMEASDEARQMSALTQSPSAIRSATMGAREGGGELLAVDINWMRDELFFAASAGAQASFTTATDDLKLMLEGLGFTIKKDIETSSILRQVGYDVDAGRLNEKQLRKAVIDIFKKVGYQPNLQYEQKLEQMMMRHQRLQTLQRGLGHRLDVMPVRDPERFFRWLRKADADLAAEVTGKEVSAGSIKRAKEFQQLVMPADAETIVSNRIANIITDIQHAERRGDTEEVARLFDEMAGLGIGRRPRDPNEPMPMVQPAEEIPPAPSWTEEELALLSPEARAALPLPPTPQLDENEVSRLRSELETAKSKVTDVDNRLAEAEARSSHAVNPPQVSGPGSLGDFAASIRDEVPRDRFSTADGLVAELEMTQFLRTLPPGTRADELPVEQQQMLEEFSSRIQMMDANPWLAEPPEYKQRARDLRQAADEGSETPLPQQSPVAPSVADSEEIVALRAERLEAQRIVDDTQRQLDEMHAAGAIDDPTAGVERPMVQDPERAALEAGTPGASVAPDQIPPQSIDQGIPDEELTPKDLAKEYKMASNELEALKKTHGKISEAPREVQERAASLAARVKQLVTIQDQVYDRAAKAADPLEKIPQFIDYKAEQARLTELLGPPSIDYDWYDVLERGSVRLTEPRLVGALAKPGAGQVGQRGRIVRTAETFGATGRDRQRYASMAAEQAALEAKKGPYTRVQRELEQLGELTEAEAESTAARLARAESDSVAVRMDQLAGEMAAEAEPAGGTLAGMAADANAAREAELQGVTDQMRAVDDYRNTIEGQRAHAMANSEKMYREAQDNYDTQLRTIGMQLGDVRSELRTLGPTARGEMAAAEAAQEQFERALNAVPRKDASVVTLLRDMYDINEARAASGAPAVEIEATRALLRSAIKAQFDLGREDMTLRQIQKRLDQFKKGTTIVSDVMKRVIHDGWQRIAADLIKGDDRLVIATSLATALDNVTRAMRQPASWELIDKYTAFFKTYATMRPGFHVRNAMSATFMNFVDNVGFSHMRQAPTMWRNFLRDPVQFMDNASPEVRTAFDVVFGSGAGGQFIEQGLGAAQPGIGHRAYNALMKNKLTEWNRKAGSAVEGTARLAMALDSLAKGMSPEQALERINKFHFNYTQMSRLDRQARRLIPFWTFMSRNLPLQIEEMWMRPRTYLHYQSFVRNFGEAADPLTPDYWLAQGAFTMNQDARHEDSPWYLAPDLPHLRVAEPFTAIAQGDTAKAVLSDINPAFLAPYEAFVSGRKEYTGKQLEGYEEVSTPMTPLLPLFKLLGGTATGGTSGETVVDERYAHVARSLLPTLEWTERLMDNTGTREGRQDETWLRSAGVPVYQLTDTMRQMTEDSRYYDQLDDLDRQAELARM